MNYDEQDCPRCGDVDHGWNFPDIRETLYIDNCRCKDGCVCTAEDRAGSGSDYAPDECICESNSCDCERTKIQVKILRIWDKTCGFCGGSDWRPQWLVLKDGGVVATVPSESAAHAVIEAEYPEAAADEPDYAWESERNLRIAEGWGY